MAGITATAHSNLLVVLNARNAGNGNKNNGTG